MFDRFKSAPLQLVLLASAATVAMTATPAAAQTTTPPETMEIGATVAASCTFDTTPVAFGSFDVLTAQPEITGGLNVTCTSGTTWTAAADAGLAAGATPATRQMSDGTTNLLDYALYTDAARTLIWGDATAGTELLAGTGNGALQNAPIYASILPGQQSVPAGVYADTVSVTVTY